MNEPINPILMAPCKEEVNTLPLSLEKLNHHDLPYTLKVAACQSSESPSKMKSKIYKSHLIINRGKSEST